MHSPNARGFGAASIRIFSQKSNNVGAQFIEPVLAGSMNRTPTSKKLSASEPNPKHTISSDEQTNF